MKGLPSPNGEAWTKATNRATQRITPFFIFPNLVVFEIVGVAQNLAFSVVDFKKLSS
jgi:hypothetical protein